MFANMTRSSIALAAALALSLALSACAHNNRQPRRAAMARPARAACRNSTRRSATASSSPPIRPISPPTAQATLDKQAAWLNQYNKYSFTIEGHADERGTREYNFALGSRRAQAVHDYLAAKGVSASRMRTISYGKERPVAVCDDISCWSQNRRAVTVLNGAAGSS